MKKYLLLVFLLTVLAGKGFAQSEKIRLGLKISPLFAFSSITDDKKNTISGVDSETRLGFGGGLLFTYQFQEKFGFQSGINIVSKGFKYSIPNSNASTTTTLTTVEIPVLLNMRTNEIANGLRVRGIFGGSLNVLTGAKTTATLLGITGTTKDTDGYYRLVPDFVVGAGVEWNLQNIGTLDLGVSYHAPLMPAYDKGNTRIKISYIALDLGYYF